MNKMFEIESFSSDEGFDEVFDKVPEQVSSFSSKILSESKSTNDVVSFLIATGAITKCKDECENAGESFYLVNNDKLDSLRQKHVVPNRGIVKTIGAKKA
ncbi:MAG: hypothetical protein RSA10_01170 [Bacilli bacterium]